MVRFCFKTFAGAKVQHFFDMGKKKGPFFDQPYYFLEKRAQKKHNLSIVL